MNPPVNRKPTLPILRHSEVYKTEVASNGVGNDGAILQPEEQVLSTLSRDGKRRWIIPSLAAGKTWQWRRIFGFSLIAFFVALPHLRINDRPYILLDIPSRQFTFFGHTFYPTDTPLLACLLLGSFFTIMLATSLAGRVWCGWACPHTVYMEFVFRPVDRFFDGTLGRGGATRKPLSGLKRIARFLVYLILCSLIAHVFLSYFVGTDRLARWLQTPPWQHPTAFLVMVGSTAAMTFHGLFFREQLCLIACPYGRFQSVMLDRKSLIVAYDPKRGEPRKRGKRQAKSTEKIKSEEAGDCVDCGRCTAVCPTGIDIRKGLQMECVHCAQCIDACNAIMERIQLPTGLIRYTSQDGLEGKPIRFVRPRTVIYSALVVASATLFLFILSFKFAFDARVFRGTGAPFSAIDSRSLQNNFKIRLINRSQTEQVYEINTDDPDIVVKWSLGENVRLQPGQSALALADVKFPMAKVSRDGFVSAKLIIKDSLDATRELAVRLLGPR
jgi:cytochrome c oxidase accessory protein FixG